MVLSLIDLSTVVRLVNVRVLKWCVVLLVWGRLGLVMVMTWILLTRLSMLKRWRVTLFVLTKFSCAATLLASGSLCSMVVQSWVALLFTWAVAQKLLKCVCRVSFAPICRVLPLSVLDSVVVRVWVLFGVIS